MKGKRGGRRREGGYRTERGVWVEVRAIPLLLDEIRQAHESPAAPMYTERLAGGVEVEKELTDEIAENSAKHQPEWWEQYAEAWAEYLELRETSDQRLNEKLWNAVCLEAIQVEMPEDEGWAQKQALLYDLTPPEDPLLRLLHYVKTEVVGGPRDVIGLSAMASGAQVDEEVLATAEASFRGLLQGNLAEGLADQGRAVADEPAVSGDEDGEGVGADAE